MLSTIIAFVALVNPFALFLYLEPVRKDLEYGAFLKVILKATLISFTISMIFFILGDFIIRDIFQIHFESFRIFGGIVIFTLAYHFIIKGEKAMIMIKEDLDDLASEIALPFMVGAGTISLTILMSQRLGLMQGVVAHAAIFGSIFCILMFFVHIRKSIERKRFRVAFDKNMTILLRLNGFFLGAIGIDMIGKGIISMFF